MKMLPRAFRPNRTKNAAPLTQEDLTPIKRALHDAARANLAAMLRGAAPVAMDMAPFARFFPTRRRWTPSPLTLAGDQPDRALAARLMRRPARLGPMTRIGAGFGAEAVLPVILRQILSDSILRHELGQSARRFLSERVLFHPGQAPTPLFTPAVIGLVATAATESTAPERAGIAAAASEVAASDGLDGFWDQWLLRRMADAGWPKSWPSDLPWLSFTGGSDFEPSAPVVGEVPPAWASILLLVP